MLCLAQAEDRLTVEAFESRLTRVKQAPNEATLAAILADIEPTSSFPAPIISGGHPVAVADHTGMAAPVAPADLLRVSSVFASTKRAGSWTVPLLIEGKALLGELTLDLRDAVFGSDVVDIQVDVMLGSFTLIVPAGTQVENEVDETLSSSTHSTRGPTDCWYDWLAGPCSHPSTSRRNSRPPPASPRDSWGASSGPATDRPSRQPGCRPQPLRRLAFRADGQRAASTQRSHWGRLAMQTWRPWWISQCETTVQSRRGTRGIRSRSIFSASVCLVSRSNPASRVTWVSTTIPSLIPKALPNTTLAVFRPTPGRTRSASMSAGTSPPCRSTNSLAIPIRLLVLFR